MTDHHRSVREVSIDLSGFKQSVDRQFAYTHRLIFYVGAVLLAMAGGGFAIYKQIGDLQSDVTGLQHDVSAINERLTKIEKYGSDSAESQGKIQTLLSQINTRLAASQTQDIGPFAPVDLNSNERALVAKFLGAKPEATPPKFSLGDLVSGEAVKPLPAQLVAAVPKLAGAKFTFNSGWIILTGAGNRVVATVGGPPSNP